MIEYEGSRIIVTYSPTRARNDAHKRDKAIEKLQKKLKRSRKPASFSSRGYGRFLSFPDTGDVTIVEALIKDAAKWDGLHAILIHGADDLDTQDVIAPDITNCGKSKPASAPTSMISSRSGPSITGPHRGFGLIS